METVLEAVLFWVDIGLILEAATCVSVLSIIISLSLYITSEFDKLNIGVCNADSAANISAGITIITNNRDNKKKPDFFIE